MRVNTFSLNFSEISEKLSVLEVHRFIEQKLKLKNEEVVSIALYGSKVFVKVASQGIFESIFDKFEGKLIYEDSSGSEYPVQLESQSSKITLRIHKIPIEVPESEVRKALGGYGNIDSVNNDAWKNLPYRCYNDTKLVKVDLNKAVPSYVSIQGRSYLVTYPGQARTCRRCGSIEHEIKDCDKSISIRLIRRSDYATVASQRQRYPVNLVPNEEIVHNYQPLRSEPVATSRKISHTIPEVQKENAVPQEADVSHSVEDIRNVDEAANEVTEVTKSLERSSPNPESGSEPVANVEQSKRVGNIPMEIGQCDSQLKRKKNAGTSSEVTSGEEDTGRPSPHKKIQYGGSWADELEDLSETPISYHGATTSDEC